VLGDKFLYLEQRRTGTEAAAVNTIADDDARVAAAATVDVRLRCSPARPRLAAAYFCCS